jgi:4-amino-4-deoxy-L-arabinose transferase-like glycosyltransferase
LATAVVRVLIGAGADLKVEEAYYWCYAQHLSPGYFDHPPMVAWLIALFSPLGTHPLAVRLPAILLFAATGWLLFSTLRRLWNDSVAMTGLALHSLLPAYSWYSLVMLPDVPLMFFWTLGMYATTRLIQEERARWWWLIGVATGLGMDSKYPCVLIPVAAFLACMVLKKPRKLWLGFPMWGSALLAIVLFSPVIYWNVTHDMASFRFQGAERFQEPTSPREKAASLIYPAVMLGPLIYLASPWVMLWAWKRRRELPVQMGLCWTLPFLLLMLWVSSKRLVAINWPLPGYLGFLLLLSPWIAQARWRWLLVAPAALFSLLPFWALVFPLAQANRGDDITQWKPMTSHALRIQSEMPRPDKTFFLGYGYQAAAHLTFGGIPKERVVSVNALGMRALAYDYWVSPQDFVGWDGVVVAYSRVKSNGNWHPQMEVDLPRLQACFESLEGPFEYEEMRAGQRLRLYRYWKAFGYRGRP